MNQKLKNFIYIALILILIIFVLPWLIGFSLKHTSNFGTFGNNSDWFSFWSNYLGAIIGVIGVFAIFFLERKNEKTKDEINIENENAKNKTMFEEEVYNNFIIKYYYYFLLYLEYLLVTYGHNKKFTIEQFELKLNDYIRDMLIDFKYASSDLKKSLKAWEYYDYYDDLKGDQKQIVQIQIAQELFIQTYSISESLNKQDFPKNFWIYFSILILSKTDTSNQSIEFYNWYEKYFTIYTEIINEHPNESEQKALCTQAYKIYSESDNKSEELKKLFNID
ncbi:MAG: hypothetical protein ACLT12_03485 [Lactococcus lactis]